MLDIHEILSEESVAFDFEFLKTWKNTWHRIKYDYNISQISDYLSSWQRR
jgi:hypothetical protein